MNNKLIEMWAALLAYLPQAIANGHGESWAKMCREQTSEAAAAAAEAADAIAAAAADATAAAAYAAATTDFWAQIAIDRIKTITKLEPI